MSGAPLHELDPSGRFSDRASAYARFRPSYPPAAVQWCLEGLECSEKPIVVDCGAGTGISSRLFADRGARVIALEPNESMRRVAEPHEGVVFRAGSAEATGLATASADLVVCAQAFHWFNADLALAEFARIVKPRGRLALLVNERDEEDAVTREYSEALREAVDRELSEGMARAIDEALARNGLRAELRKLRNTQALGGDAFIGRAESSSYVPKHGPRAERLRERLRKIFETHRDATDVITMVYRTVAWRVTLL